MLLTEEQFRLFGYTKDNYKEKINKQLEKENAAFALCSGLLGNCFLMGNAIEWMLDKAGHNAYTLIKSQKWFKLTLKKKVNLAIEKLHFMLTVSRINSPTNSDYMLAVADNMYENIKSDLDKLIYSVELELSKKITKYPVKPIALFIVIEMMLRWIVKYYDDTLEQMNKIYKADYHSQFSNARCTISSTLWSDALEIFGCTYVDKPIDLNQSLSIKAGIAIIDKKMRDEEISDNLREEASKLNEEGAGLELFYNALKVLEIDGKSQHKKQLKQAKKEYKDSAYTK